MGLLISKKSINGNTRKRRDIDNKLGIFNAKFLKFFFKNKLVFVYKNILHSQQALFFRKILNGFKC